MAWIDTTIVEGDFQNDFLELVQTAGWELTAHFKKVAFPASPWINPIAPKNDISDIQFGVAEHFIVRPPGSKVHYGIALYGQMQMKYGLLPLAVRPWTDIEKIPQPGTIANIHRPKTKYKEMGVYITNLYPYVKQRQTVYMYMCDQVPDFLETNEDIVIGWDGDIKRAALDIEVHETEYWEVSGQAVFQIKSARPDYMQSPVMPVHLRVPILELRDDGMGMKYVAEKTNWWPDSKIEVKGQLNNDHLALVIRADPQGAFDNNRVPSIPIFMGKFISLDPQDQDNYALHGGSAFKTDSPTFDFDNPTRFYPETDVNIMPLQKNYIMHPSSGIDSVMVYRGQLGGRYQAHFLSWDTGPNTMPPQRIGTNGGKYPDAWLQPDTDVYKYKFNPSEYTNEVEVTKAYIIHPGEGKRGYLPSVIMHNPLSIVSMDRVKVRTSTCPDKFDVYRFFLPGAVSPYSKLPGTAYRQAGMSIFQTEE